MQYNSEVVSRGVLSVLVTPLGPTTKWNQMTAVNYMEQLCYIGNTAVCVKQKLPLTEWKDIRKVSLTGANISLPSREPSASDWRAMNCPMESRAMSAVALVGLKLFSQLESQFDSINCEFTVSSLPATNKNNINVTFQFYTLRGTQIITVSRNSSQHDICLYDICKR